MTGRCSSLVRVASGAAIFTLLLRRRVAFLHRTATCRPLFKPRVSLLSTYKIIELGFEFLSLFFLGFHSTFPRTNITPRNVPEERRSHLHRGSPKSHIRSDLEIVAAKSVKA